MKIKTLIVLIITFTACQEKVVYDKEFHYFDKHNGDTISLIEHPYIFQDLGIKVERFELIKNDPSSELSITLAGDLSKINKESFVYVHGFENPTKKEITNLDLTKQTNVSKTKVIFSNTFSTIPENLGRIEFGLTDFKNKERIFAINLNNISLIFPE